MIIYSTSIKHKSSQVIFFFLVCFLTFSSCKEQSEYEKITEKKTFLLGESVPDSHFLGDQKCKQCHQNEFEAWQGSHHDKAMQDADSTSVLADFKGEKFTSQGVTSHFYKRNTDFFVNTEGPDGNYHEYKIVYTFGVFPLQQYIVQFPNGHYQCLRTAWDAKKNTWFDLYPNFKVVHSEWLHWSRGGLNWNNMCADCHSTNVRKNYDQKTHSYTTKYAIKNVSCEACHGPGKQHVADVNELGEAYKQSGTFSMTSNTKPKELVDQCARCHMRREQHSTNFNFEGTMMDHYFPQIIESEFYHPDGQISDEVYVYGSFVQSKMYKNNVTCSDCHNSHSLKLKFDGNKLCTQCHLPEQYDTPKHSFHKMNTEASKCINCHMPGKFYMGNDFRRDHSFRVPRPDLSLKYNAPNACTQCHKDKTDQWASDAFKQLYGEVDSIHFSEKLAPGIMGLPEAHIGLQELINDENESEIVRASAVKAISKYQITNLIEQYIALLNDPSPIVRGTTLDVMSEINSTDYASYFLPLLADPKRSVRIKAFYGLGVLDELQIPEDYKENYVKVKEEFYDYLNINSDFVGGRIKKANYYIKKGDLKSAIASYESALQIDNINNQVRLGLANLYYQDQNFLKAEETFKLVIEQESEFGPVYYSLALLYAEMNRIDDALIQMKNAVKYMPTNTRTYYNLSLLYEKKQDDKNAEAALVNGLKIDPANESLLYTLAYHYYTREKLKKAQNILVKLVDLYPNNIQYTQFLDQVTKVK